MCVCVCLCVRACVRACVCVCVKYSIGPNTDPCGTPLKTDFHYYSLSSVCKPLFYPVDYSIAYAMSF